MSNKSSVKLFAIALYEKGFLQGNGDEINDLLEHYKAIHKEEMVEFAFKTYHYISGIMKVPFNKLSENRIHAETIYEQTYGGNNEQQ